MKKFIASILPGLFLIGFNIGTGSVTAMSKAGADYGMGLLWALLVSCIITFYLMMQFGKFTAISGLTALEGIRKHIHPAVSIFLIVALTINVSGGIMGVMGIVNSLLEEWSSQWPNGGLSAIAWTGITVTLVYLLFLTGKTKTFEKALSLMVALMGVAFFSNLFILRPDGGDILKGLIPNIPDAAKSTSGGPLLVLAGMVGTTISSMVFLVRTTLVKEQGWTVADLPIQRRDAAVSASVMFLISAAIMAAAATTIHAKGGTLNDVKDMVVILKPFAGELAIGLFVLGIVAAGLSSHFPNIILLPWLITDYASLKRDWTRLDFRLIVLVMSLLSFVVPVFHQRPVLVLIASQTLAAIVLPVTVACIWYLTNKQQLMGEHKMGTIANVSFAVIQLFALFIGFVGLRGVIDMLSF